MEFFVTLITGKPWADCCNTNSLGGLVPWYQEVCRQWGIQELFRGFPPNSVEDRGQREEGSGGGSPLVRGSAQFANKLNPYSD
jgi:hypothetical protein